MGARMMSGHTKYHEQLENELAALMKESAWILDTKELCPLLMH
jgi:glycine C-acetyltransferase